MEAVQRVLSYSLVVISSSFSSVSFSSTTCKIAKFFLCRSPALSQTKDMIECVYASKEKFDTRCVAQRWPTQTMSKFFEEFLVHKYGLRSMAKGHEQAARTAVEKLEGEDNYVRVFGMTLRNEVR